MWPGTAMAWSLRCWDGPAACANWWSSSRPRALPGVGISAVRSATACTLSWRAWMSNRLNGCFSLGCGHRCYCVAKWDDNGLVQAGECRELLARVLSRSGRCDSVVSSVNSNQKPAVEALKTRTSLPGRTRSARAVESCRCRADRSRAPAADGGGVDETDAPTAASLRSIPLTDA